MLEQIHQLIMLVKNMKSIINNFDKKKLEREIKLKEQMKKNLIKRKQQKKNKEFFNKQKNSN